VTGKRLLNSFGRYLSKSDHPIYIPQLGFTGQECVLGSRRLFQHTRALQERGGSPEGQIAVTLEAAQLFPLAECGL